MNKHYQIFLLLLFSVGALLAQTPQQNRSGRPNLPNKPMDMPLVDTTVLWVELMMSPNPNYFAVKRAFDTHFKGVIPQKGQGFKVFKRWESRVINHLDANGNVVWPNGVLGDLQSQLSVTTSGSSGSIGGPASGSGVSGLNAGNPVTPATWCATSGRWSAVGPSKHPYNQSSQPTGTGRINGLAFHPKDSNTFFALAPQGGVWKTIDYGKSWYQLWGAGTGLAIGTSAPSNPSLTLGVSTMVLSYRNPDTLYIGTGDRDAGDAPGYGVLMSPNGGTSFVVRNSGMGNVTVGKMIMHPKNTAVILAATNNGIYRTANSGGSWTKVSGTANFVDIVYHPSNPNNVYATASGLFYRSTDGGLTFTQITNGVPATGMQRGQIAVTPADPKRVYFLIASGSRFQGYYLSQDSGTSFVNQNSSPANILGYSEIGNDGSGQGWYDLDLSADPANANVVYAFGVNIWKSTDAGVTFKINGHWVGSGSADDVHADQHIGEFGITGKTLFAGNDGGVYYTRNGGKVWNNITNGINNSQIYRLAVAQTVDDLGAHGYQDNGSMQHDDGEVFTYFGGDGMDCAVDPTDESYVYGSYVYGWIYRAIDKNDVITLAQNGTNGITEGGGWLTPFVLQEGNPNRMFAGYNNMWRCDSVKSKGAIKWTRISTGWTGSVRQIKSSKSNPRHLYVIRGDGKLMFTRNVEALAPVWVDVTPNTALFVPRIMEPDPLDSSVLYAASTNALYKSINNGVTWNSTALASLNKTAYPGFDWGVINVLKADHSVSPAGLYVGTDRAVYYMNQVSGSSYGLNEFANQLPLWMDVSDLDIYHSPLGRDYSYIYASTYGRGVWKSPLFDAGSGTYQSKLFSYDSIFVVGGVMKLEERVPASVSGLKGLEWSITPNTYSWVSGNANSMQPEIKFNKEGVYEVALTAKSCAASAVSTKKIWVRVFTPPQAATCNSKTNFQTSNFGIGVFDVKLTDNHFESGTYFDDGEMVDKSLNKVFRIKPSTDYTVQVKVGLYNNENVRVFVDYNNDGKFQNYLGEVSTQVSAAPSDYAQVKIKAPASIKQNQGFRMRVISDYNNVDTTGCGTCNYGQAEDFTVVYEKSSAAFTMSKQKICAGDSVVFRDSSQGLIGLYEWDFGVGASPQKVSGIGPWTVKYSSSGFKNVKLRLNAGEDSLVKNSLLEVIKNPIATTRVKMGNNPQCEGQEFALVANDNQKLNIKYNWYKAGKPHVQLVADSLLYFGALLLQDTGEYFAVLENRGCFDSSALVKVDVWAKPTAKISHDLSYMPCQKGNAFEFTDTSSIDKGKIVQLTWNTTAPNKTGTAKKFTQTYTAAGNYKVGLEVKSDFGCVDTAEVQVLVKGHPVAKFNFLKADQCDVNNAFQVVNTSLNPVASGGGSVTYFYNWGDGNAATDVAAAKHNYGKFGKYDVQMIVKNASNCYDTSTQIATVYLTPKASFSISKAEVCAGENLTINDLYLSHADLNDKVVAIMDFGDTRKLNRQIALKNGQRDTLFNYSSFGNYALKQVLKTSKLGCVDSAQMSIIVNSVPVVNLNASPLNVCANMQFVNFANNTTNPDGKSMSHNWLMGDNLGVFTTASPSYQYAKSGRYTARYIANNRGCTDTGYTQEVRVLPQVYASFGNVDFLKNNRFGTQFFALDTTNVPLDRKFDWTFEKQGVSTVTLKGVRVEKYFQYNGSYQVKLLAQNSIGCMDSLEKTIQVNNAILKNQLNELDAYVFPNPTINKTTYKFSAKKGDVVTVKMYTILGQKGLYEKTWNITEDGTYFDDIAMKRWNLSSGLYPLVIERGDQRFEVMMILIE